MKRTKKIFSLAIAIMVCMTMMCVPVNADTDSTTTTVVTSDLQQVERTVEPTEDNDLFIDQKKGYCASGTDADSIALKEGYSFVSLGTDLASKYWPAHLFKEKSEALPDEEAVYTNGDVSYYTQQTESVLAKLKKMNSVVKGLYINGEHVNKEIEYTATWGNLCLYKMYEPNSGNTFSTYCADFDTSCIPGNYYNIENVEDAAYYSAAEAGMIRAIAANGYWGTESGLGSLSEFKEMLAEAENFTTDEISAVTDGIAMTATQLAIWKYSNKNLNIEFVNVLKQNNPKWGSFNEAEEASSDLIFKIYEYLIHLDPITIEDNTTANTVLTDNSITELTIVPKAGVKDHPNNNDEDTDNDVFIVDMTIKLAVRIASDNGDNLVAKVLDADGNVIASGRIAGEAQEGESVLKETEVGEYTFENITLAEGETIGEIVLEGKQNLKEGVYLYTSEMEQSITLSQTMVGIAQGISKVDASMSKGTTWNVDLPPDYYYEDSENNEEDVTPPSDNPVDEPVDGNSSVNEEENSDIQESGETNDNAAQTGDSVPIELFFGLMIAAAAGMTVIRKKSIK